jgi:hypothetical protein
MRRSKVGAWAGAVVALAALVGSPAGATGATWSSATELSGTAQLNTGGYAQVSSVSCPASGSCGAVGGFSATPSITEAFVTSESNGQWGTAEQLPGFAALNAGGGLGATMAISCPAAGACSVGGSYSDAGGVDHAFVDSETGGTWGQAEEVPGFAVLNTNGLASALVSLSCASAGNCSAGGIYAQSATDFEPWVDTEVNGTWAQAEEVPGITGINLGASASVFSVSCASAGNCGATGQFTDAAKDTQVFVLNEVDGAWGNALAVPGVAAASSQNQPLPPSIDCRTATSCSLAFDLEDATGTEQSYVDSETGATWADASAVAGVNSATLGSLLVALSCSSVGQCTAVGAFGDSQKNAQAMVVDQVGGVWQPAIEVPNSAALNAGGGALMDTVACYADGYCVAGGVYTDAAGSGQALVAGESAGVWQPAIELSGSAGLNAGGDGGVVALGCARDGACAVGGYYKDGSSSYQALVDSRAAAFTRPPAPTVRVSATGPTSVHLVVRGASRAEPAATALEYSVDGRGWHRLGPRRAAVVVGHLRPSTTYQIAVRVVNALGAGRPRRVVVRTRP